MTIVETLFGETPASQHERLRTQLASVALLVARTDRDVTQHDILLATVFELLEDSALTFSQLQLRVEEAWPRLRLSEQQLRATLDAAVMIEHVSELAPVGAIPMRYELLDAGRRCLEESQLQATRTIERFTAQVADALRDRGAYRDAADAGSIVGMVMTALRATVADAVRSDTDAEVTHLRGGLHIHGASLDSIDELIEQRVQDPDRADVIRSLTTMALDHSRDLGNELVHRLIVGHILYAFMPRPDRDQAMQAAGPLSGERLILDTPVLVALLGPPDTSKPIINLLALARQVGVEVVLFDRTVDELRSTLTNTGNHEAASLGRQLRDGADPRVLARLQRQNRMLWGWLYWASTEVPGGSWDDWRSSNVGDNAMLGLLGSLGVVAISDESIQGDFELSARFVSFEEELRQRVEAGFRSRGDAAIRHDALNLVAVLRARRANPSSEVKAWPGAFMLTTDGYVNETYTAVAGNEPYPAAITFSQCADLIASYSSPRVSEELAFDLASEVAEEILLSRAATVPVEVAGELVRALRTEPVSEGEAEQLAFEIYRTMSDRQHGTNSVVDDPEELAGELARRLRERRQRRDAEDQEAHAANVRRAELADARRAKELEDKNAEVDRLTADNQAKDDEIASRDESDRVRGRERRADGVVVIAMLVSVALLARGFVLPGLVGLVACLVGFVEGRRWARDTGGLSTLALALVYGGFTIWPAVSWAMESL